MTSTQSGCTTTSTGSAGDDDVICAGTASTVQGGEGGNDTLMGGLGTDHLDGGAGTDNCMQLSTRTACP